MISTMAENNVDNIKLDGAQATRAILDALAELRTLSLGPQLTRIENNQRRWLNSQQLSTAIRPRFLPPLHPVTGVEIPDCPTTKAQIFRLSKAKATRILQELQAPVPAGLEAQRNAVLDQYTVTR